MSRHYQTNPQPQYEPRSPAATTAAAVVVPRPQWAGADDWARHRPKIILMYRDLSHTLAMVQRVMERDHDFFATDKMYKTRFRRWGIHKNNTRKRREMVQRQNQQQTADEESTTPSSSSTPPPSTALTVATTAAAAATGSRKRTSSPPAYPDPTARITFFPSSSSSSSAGYLPPDSSPQRAYQAALNAMYEYAGRVAAPGFPPSTLLSLSSCSSSSSYPPSPYVPGSAPSPSAIYSPRTTEWPARMARGARLIRRGKVREGFALVERCFGEFGRLGGGVSGASSASRGGERVVAAADDGGAAADPELLHSVFNVGFGAFALSTVSPQLCMSFVRFAARLLAIRGGSSGGGGGGGGRWSSSSSSSSRDPLCRFAEALLQLQMMAFEGARARVRKKSRRRGRSDEPSDAEGTEKRVSGEKEEEEAVEDDDDDGAEVTTMGIGLCWRNLEIIEHRQGDRFTAEHRTAFVRLHSWCASLLYGEEVDAGSIRKELGVVGDEGGKRDDKDGYSNSRTITLDPFDIITRSDPLWKSHAAFWGDMISEAATVWPDEPRGPRSRP